MSQQPPRRRVGWGPRDTEAHNNSPWIPVQNVSMMSLDSARVSALILSFR